MMFGDGIYLNMVLKDIYDCYTVKRFCADNPELTGILATGTHVIAVANGNYYDTWDSGEEVPIYYWRLEN